MEMLRMKVVTP